MFASVGSQVSVENLLQGMIVQSGNDATVALAEHVGGTEDALSELMNQYAEKLGMKNTHYVDASGLTSDPGITYRRWIWRSFHAPSSTSFQTTIDSSLPKKNSPGTRSPSRTAYRCYSPTRAWMASKPATRRQAGYCMVVSALRDDMRLIAVVMGTPSEKARAIDDEALLNYGFNFYESHKLYAAGTTITSIKVWKGAGGNVPVGVTQDVYVTIPKGGYPQLTASQQTPSGLIAPVAGTHRQVRSACLTTGRL